MDIILENGTSCSIIVCIKKLSFLKENEISSCEVGENLTLCGIFSLRFEQGTISHHDILNHNLAVQLGIDKGRAVQLPDSIIEMKNSYEKDNDIRIDDIEPIYLGENILKGVSLALGAFIFLACCTFILYLKCRT